MPRHGCTKPGKEPVPGPAAPSVRLVPPWTSLTSTPQVVRTARRQRSLLVWWPWRQDATSLHWNVCRCHKAYSTLRAPLSGTFRQTLPDLVTPLKGHYLSVYSVQRCRQRPPKGSDTNNYDCRSNLAPKHERKHETHPPRVKERVLSRFKQLWFLFFVFCAGVNFLAAINDQPCFIWVVFVTNLLLFEHQQKKSLVSWQFSGLYGITKYGSGCRKDVVNQCLEFGPTVMGTLLIHRTAA